MRELNIGLFQFKKYQELEITGLVITTNGAKTKQGDSVMGTGVALKAKQLWPILPKLVGAYGPQGYVGLFFIPNTRQAIKIFALQTKEHWRGRSSLKLITANAEDLVKSPVLLRSDTIIMPRLGYDNGKLDWENQVKPAISHRLDNRFIVASKGV
jgi:hypothetical protein